MLPALTQRLMELYPQYGFLRVFQYLTFRAVMTAMTALILGLLAGPWVIRRLRELKIGQPVRGYGMETHLSKSGTPTMGGILILLSIAISTFLWADLTNRFVWIVLIVTLGFGAIGWADDWRKVVRKDPEGMPSREKFLWQTLIGLGAALYLMFSISESDNYRVIQLVYEWIRSGFDINLPPKAGLMVPFFKQISYPLGVFGFVALTFVVIIFAWIPVVGWYCSMAIVALLAFSISPTIGIISMIYFFAFSQLDCYVIQPRIFSKSLEVPPSLIILGALSGGILLGIVGALVAIPVTASLLLVYREVIVPRLDAS